ncbi:MAG: hypothetical protein WDZ77_03325 [Candidatus Pacearchaeota archaeon]
MVLLNKKHFLFLFLGILLSVFLIGKVSAGFTYYSYEQHYNVPAAYNKYYEKESLYFYPHEKAWASNPRYYDYGSEKYTRNDLHRYKGKNYHTSTPLNYKSYGAYDNTYGVFGSKINQYDTWVKNSEPKAGYFTVKFHLSDGAGNKRFETVTKYVKPYERKHFEYRNVFDDDYDYYLGYEIISHNKILRTKHYPHYY